METADCCGRVKRFSNNWLALLLPLAFEALAPEARAAGGAHIVDDADVETPGTCHLEYWTAKFVPGDGYANFAPACTFTAMPTLEIGAALQHYWDVTTGAPLFGPQIKLNLWPTSSGIGVALGFNGGVNLTTGEVGLAQAIVPVTIPFDENVRLNLNAGWSYLASDKTLNAMFYGAQIEATINTEFMLMIEAFGRTNAAAGVQMGVRYTPRAWVDFDVLVGNTFDTATTRFFTLGVTLRY